LNIKLSSLSQEEKFTDRINNNNLNFNTFGFILSNFKSLSIQLFSSRYRQHAHNCVFVVSATHAQYAMKTKQWQAVFLLYQIVSVYKNIRTIRLRR
jgi:hypothetical protein